MDSVSVIVPIYNESLTLKDVVISLLNCKCIQEIICVNDGSNDGTMEILNSYRGRIKVIDLKENHGKGYAMVRGLKECRGDIILFIDADLINLQEKNILELLIPVLANQADGVIGYIEKGRKKNVFKIISGQRCYRKKDLLPLTDLLVESRFGAEIILNESFNGKRILWIKLNGVGHLNKHEKWDPVVSFKEYVREGVEIAREVGKREIFTKDDLQLLTKLKDVKTFQEVKKVISMIGDRQLKDILESYFRKYLEHIFPKKG